MVTCKQCTHVSKQNEKKITESLFFYLSDINYIKTCYLKAHMWCVNNSKCNFLFFSSSTSVVPLFSALEDFFKSRMNEIININKS